MVAVPVVALAAVVALALWPTPEPSVEPEPTTPSGLTERTARESDLTGTRSESALESSLSNDNASGETGSGGESNGSGSGSSGGGSGSSGSSSGGGRSTQDGQTIGGDGGGSNSTPETTVPGVVLPPSGFPPLPTGATTIGEDPAIGATWQIVAPVPLDVYASYRTTLTESGWTMMGEFPAIADPTVGRVFSVEKSGVKVRVEFTRQGYGQIDGSGISNYVYIDGYLLVVMRDNSNP